MLLKNNLDGNVQLYYATTVNGRPDVKYVHIPGKATVELDDKIYQALLKPKTEVRLKRMVETTVEGESEVKMDKKNVIIKDFEDTGETKMVNLFEEQIKAGDFSIVERVKVTKEQMLKVLAEHSIVADKMSDEQISALYNKLA